MTKTKIKFFIPTKRYMDVVDLIREHGVKHWPHIRALEYYKRTLITGYWITIEDHPLASLILLKYAVDTGFVREV